MKKEILLIAIVIFSSLTVTNSENISATSPVAKPYIQIYCDINVSFLDDNLCDTYDCEYTIEKNDNYWVFSSYDGYFHESYLFIRKNKIEIHNDNYTFSNSTIELLENICYQNISPVIKYVNNGNLTRNFNNFFHYQPPNKPDKYALGYSIINIDEKWYLESYNMDYGRWLDDINNSMYLEIVIFILMCIFVVVVFIIMSIKIYKKKFKKQKK